MSQVQWKNFVPVFSGPPPSKVQKMLDKLKNEEDAEKAESSSSNEVPSDEGGICTHCNKSFDAYAKFLRHVTHSKACLDAHDPFVIEKIKRKSRLRSKAKWNKKNKDRLKEDRKMKSCSANVKQSKASSYITVGEKRSFKGKCFYKLFDVSYDVQVQLAETRMEELSKRQRLSQSLKMELMDEAIDDSFNSTDQVFDELPLEAEEEILDSAFESLNSNFENNFEEKCSDQLRIWKENRLDDVTNGLFHSTLDGAYRNFFKSNAFNDLIQTAENSALDQLFLNIVENDDSFNFDDKNPHNFEKMLQSRFEQESKNEVKNCVKGTKLQQDLQSYLNKAFTKRFLKEGLTFKD